MKHINALDGVRAIAILLVMLFHFHYLLEIGWIGVQLFFVLSGFLITSILLKQKEENLSLYLKRFYWRRSLRIFPLYYLYIAIISLTFLVLKYPPEFPKLFPYLVAYIYNYQPLIHGLNFDGVFTHFWSLSVEEQFYLFWPFLIYFTSKKQLKYLLIGIIIFSPVFRFIAGIYFHSSAISVHTIGEVIYRLLPSQLDGFAFGALIPVFSLDKLEKPFDAKFIIGLMVFILAGLTNWYFLDAGPHTAITSLGFPIGNIENYSHVWSYTLINAFSLFFILLVLNAKESAWYNRLLSTNILVRIGKVSYGLYVYHWILLTGYRKLIGKHIVNDFISFIVYFLLCYIVSEISFRLFESFFISLKDKKFKHAKLATKT